MSLIVSAFWIGLGVLLVTSFLVIIGQWRLFLRREQPSGQASLLPVDSQAIAQHLAEAIRCQTTPRDEQGTPDPEAFRQLHHFLAERYPLVHAHLKREVINGYSLLYVWKGSDPGLPPAQFMAHQDVVSCPEDTLADWTYPPFAGVIADGFIWGRGALDIKNQVIGILEAAETLLAQGFQPQRTLHFAFGHDEETGGANGARVLGQLLHERGVSLAGIVDEGGGIFDGLSPGVQGLVAGICFNEKGYLTIEFRVKTESGHSSMPPDHTAIGILAAAMARLEKHPIRPTLKWARHGYWGLGSVVPLHLEIAFANSWLFGPLLIRWLKKAPEASTAIRTTQALTVFQAGYEDNTIPAEACALVNF
ncbi:MAG: M20/M25/M40 family metallo-hydrolase, partial [Chloroflexota bacterium]